MRKLALTLTALAVAIVPTTFVSQAHAAGAYAVTLKTSATSLNSGQTVVFTGKVSPKAAGKEVRIQFYDTGQGGPGWATWRTSTIHSDGTYAQKFTPPKAHTRKWRVYKPSGAGLSGGASLSVTLHVYSWYKLAHDLFESLTIEYGEEFLNAHGPVTVAGTTVNTYYQSNADGGGVTRWNTQRLCKRLRVDVGVADNSAADAAAQFRVFAGSTTRIASQIVKTGTPLKLVDVAFDETTVPFIKFTSENRLDRDTYLTASNPRIQCAFYDDLG